MSGNRIFTGDKKVIMIKKTKEGRHWRKQKRPKDRKPTTQKA